MSVLRQAWDWQREIFIERVDPRIGVYPFFGKIFPAPWGVMGILLLYVYFIKSLGPRFMEKRQPYNLKKIMIVYNAVQVALSALTFYEALHAGWGGRYNWHCALIPDPENSAPEDLRAARGCFLYFCCKVLDLLDTVFIVLRKNYRQLSFLHTYHHALMIVGSWGGAAYMPGGHHTFVGFLNTFVHTIMYFYYLLTAIDPKYKGYVQVKKWITRMQLAQFVAVFLHGAQVFFQPNCKAPLILTVFVMSQSFVMMILFSNFYYQTYIKKKSA